MLSESEIKFANRLYWQVKGHLIPDSWKDDENQLQEIIQSYTTRLWGNHEADIHLEGFEQAWSKKYGK